LINPDALHKARVEALRERKTIGQWLEELIEEKLAREEREKNSQNRKKTCGGRFFRGIKQSGFVEVNPLMMPVAHIWIMPLQKILVAKAGIAVICIIVRRYPSLIAPVKLSLVLSSSLVMLVLVSNLIQLGRGTWGL